VISTPASTTPSSPSTSCSSGRLATSARAPSTRARRTSRISWTALGAHIRRYCVTHSAGADWSGNADIALIQRGTCTFGTKAHNAGLAGAEAVVIFNQGNTPDRKALVIGDATSLDDGTIVRHTIPVVGASFADGVALSAAGSTAFVEVLPPETRTDFNVIAELPGENDDNVVMSGAHLDSVTEGPGINDNGSGSAALLETALMMAEHEPQNTVRFAWWAAEELGLVGSPNYIFMVYDADESTFPAPEGVPIPDGSEAIDDLYESYFTMVGEPYDDTEFSGRSDYQAFIEHDIPSGGLFTGAEVVKTRRARGHLGRHR
jgi:Zn-dependent M28 family amino/carboxypeptidase